MKKILYFLAIDLGASSGRHIVAHKDESGEIIYEEIYRFPNSPKLENGHLTWDVEYLFNEIKNGIKKCLDKFGEIESMSIDTWAVDYVLMNGDKEIFPCYCYRDDRTLEAIEKVHEIIPFKTLYEITGCQFQKFTTIYQLYDDKLNGRLENSTDFLMLPEYFMYKLTGKKVKEFTNAGSTGLYDSQSLKVSDFILKELGLPEFIKNPVHKPQTVVGNFSESIQKELGGNIKVVLCPTHDTASAVEGIPMKDNNPYISSGTWSLLGIKNDKAITNETAFKANYSNEFGPDYIRVQKNIMGLWISQNLIKEFNLDPVTAVNIAVESTFDEIIDVNSNDFLSPSNMKKAIDEYMEKENRPLPKTQGDYFRLVYRSLAYSYKVAFEELENITGKKFEKLYIVGGGAKNRLINETTEKFLKKEIVALPIEATAIGNLKSQMGRIYGK